MNILRISEPEAGDFGARGRGNRSFSKKLIVFKVFFEEIHCIFGVMASRGVKNSLAAPTPLMARPVSNGRGNPSPLSPLPVVKNLDTVQVMAAR